MVSLGILSGSPPLPLFLFLLPLFVFPSSSSPSSLLLKVCAQSGSAQSGNTLCSSSPKWSFVAMSSASRLVPPMLRSFPCALFLYVLPMMPLPTMLLDVVNHLLHVSWHSPHYFRSRFSYYPVLLEALNPCFCHCLDSFLLYLTDEVSSVGSACGILSGPSS